MRNTGFGIVLLALTASGCNGSSRELLPVTPTPTAAAPTVSTEPPLSPPSQRPRQPELGTSIAVDQAVSSRVTPDDPLCDPGWRYRCRYFRLAVPRDGVLRVTIQWNPAQLDPYPLDMEIIGPSGSGWLGQIGRGPQRIGRGRVSGGSTYVIEVWSFLTPGEPFELLASLEED